MLFPILNASCFEEIYDSPWLRAAVKIPSGELYRPNEVIANFCGYRVIRRLRDGSLRSYSWFSRPEPLIFLPSSSSVVLMRLSGPRYRPTLVRKSGSAWNLTRTSGSAARNSDH
jgi:hypothetical protein